MSTKLVIVGMLIALTLKVTGAVQIYQDSLAVLEGVRLMLIGGCTFVSSVVAAGIINVVRFVVKRIK